MSHNKQVQKGAVSPSKDKAQVEVLPTKLTEAEKESLAEHEEVIKRGASTFFAVGHALMEIRDGKLYRDKHKTFDAYCRQRWDFSKTHANRQIQASSCEQHLRACNDKNICIPTKESQVRYIADLKPEQWEKVAAKVKESVGEREAKGSDFNKARQELFPKPKPATKTIKDAEIVPLSLVPQSDTKLVSLSELKKQADQIYNTLSVSSKIPETLKLIGRLQRDLEGWADWQIAQLKKEAA